MARSSIKLLLFCAVLLSSGYLFSGCGDLDGELSSLTVSPNSATIGVGQAQVFSALGKNSLGNIVQASVTWSVTGNIGTISSTGLFTAGSTTGEGYVVASADSLSASSKVALTDKGWLTGRIQGDFGYVSGLKVYLLEDTSLLAFTDSSGYYTISNIPAGDYEARTEETAIYQLSSQEVTVGQGETVTWNVVLTTKPGVPTTTTTTFFTF